MTGIPRAFSRPSGLGNDVLPPGGLLLRRRRQRRRKPSAVGAPGFPPANDSFADATPIGGLPYQDTQDLTAATVEPGEQQPGCFYPGTNNTEWYSFTASATESITAATNQFNVGAAVYTGDSLTSLSQVACVAYEGHVTFRAQQGTTYYFQVAVSSTINLRPVTFHLSVAPDPEARFYFIPGDPNTFDTIQFYDASSDPADVGFAAQAWDFGDGSTSTDSNPAHRYAADGDYTVRLTVATSDGRTASVTQLVHVQTHDVAIARLAVPYSAEVGQTIAVNVFVQDTRYPENVEVDLFKSIPGGFSQAGSLTQPVAVGLAGQTTRFTIKYTVTSDDKAAGKITFRADATIVDHRDGRPADNELLSTSVTIN
jgi:PKD repeat protein